MSRTRTGATAATWSRSASTTNGDSADAASGVLRRHADEDQFAGRKPRRSWRGRRPAAPAALEALALGRHDLPAGRDPGKRLHGHAQVHRQPPLDGGRRRHARDRPAALLLLGVPGTAKSWVSEHVAAAVAGDSTLLVQGTAGTSEEAIRYGWNYALLLAEGTSRGPRAWPPMRAMKEGKIARIEELTRIPADVQDTLITILSEKTLPIPELNSEVQGARRIQRDRHGEQPRQGGQRARAALKRRFQHGHPPHPGDGRRGGHDRPYQRVESPRPPPLALPAEPPGLEEVPPRRHDLPRASRRPDRRRQGEDQAAERHYEHRRGDLGRQSRGFRPGHGPLRRRRLEGSADMASAPVGRCVVKDPVQDRVVWLEYLETVVKERDGWKDLYRACREVV